MFVGDITGYIDVAQLVLYAFWIFFAGLIFYLRREDKREGYPLQNDLSAHGVRVVGFPDMPSPKTFKTADGASYFAPSGKGDDRPVKAEPAAPHPGAPLVPVGDPMLAEVGPGSYAEREHKPDMTNDGRPKLAPLRVETAFHIEERDPDPRGMMVIGGDGKAAGTVTDVWVDRGEYLIRYYEMSVADAPGASVLVPANFCRVNGKDRRIKVRALYAEHFKNVPKLENPDVVTRLEEEKVMGYFGAGTLYADPARQEPFA